MSSLSSRITTEPDKCGGRPCIRGFRLRVKDVLELLANEASWEEILIEGKSVFNLETSLTSWSIPFRESGCGWTNSNLYKVRGGRHLAIGGVFRRGQAGFVDGGVACGGGAAGGTF